MKQLENCKEIMHINKVSKYCHKTFPKKSNRDRHIKQFLENSNNTKCEEMINLNLNDGEIVSNNAMHQLMQCLVLVLKMPYGKKLLCRKFSLTVAERLSIM